MKLYTQVKLLTDAQKQLVLMYFSPRDILTQKQIIDALNFEQATVSRALQHLESEGLICWTTVEGHSKIKFYSLIKTWKEE